jgi:excisionase family DNA binding protein
MHEGPEQAIPGLPGAIGLAGISRGTLSLPEAAARLGISLKAARRAAQRGEIAAIQIGRRWLVLREPLEAMLRSAKGDPMT